VGLLANSYAEHRLNWQRAGHRVLMLEPEQIAEAIDHLDVLLLVNPNNPSGQHHDPAQLLDWHAHLAARGGWLVVDEAFIDATPEWSLARESHREGLIVLRSLGKFFGLAGARVGFVLAEEGIREALAEQLGPWTIAGPARQLASLALSDRPWQQRQRDRLKDASEQLCGIMQSTGFVPDGGCALFHWLQRVDAEAVHDALAACGILTRLYREPEPSLRVGLPRSDADRQLLKTALAWIKP
jgi:histidinol-phosphate/aromatic aminotransferase/cobyric acid decarboxylase-like protein